MKAFLAAVVMGWLALGCEKSTVDAPQQAVAVPKQVSPVKCQLAEKWDNFRGIKWGANVTSISGLVPVQISPLSGVSLEMDWVGDVDSMRFYRREGEQLTIGMARLEQIIYGFYEGQFCYLRIETNGFSDYLREAIFAKYGKGLLAGPEVGWIWYLDGGLNVTLNYKGLEMKYRPIYDDAVKKSASLSIERTKKRGEEAAKDF
jgi:hypothetical protein